MPPHRGRLLESRGPRCPVVMFVCLVLPSDHSARKRDESGAASTARFGRIMGWQEGRPRLDFADDQHPYAATSTSSDGSLFG